MDEHLSSNLSKGKIISAPMQSLNLRSFESAVSTPVSTLPNAEKFQAHQNDLEVDECQPLFFEVVWRNIGKKRTVPTSLAAAGKLKDADTAVYLYRDTNQVDGEWVVSAKAHGAADSNFILSGLTDKARVDDMVAHTQLWSCKPVWSIVDDLAQTTSRSNFSQSASAHSARP